MNVEAALTDVELAFFMSLGLSFVCWALYAIIIDYWNRHD